MRTGNFLKTLIAEMSFCLNFFFKTNFILLSGFKPMYLLESNIPNECPNIFIRRKKYRTNVQIYSLWKNSQKFERMNIFINKYLNIFEYPNICYTLSKPTSWQTVKCGVLPKATLHSTSRLLGTTIFASRRNEAMCLQNPSWQRRQRVSAEM